MMLVFTARRLVRSAHLALSPMRFTAQFDFAVSDGYLYIPYSLHKDAVCISNHVTVAALFHIVISGNVPHDTYLGPYYHTSYVL